LANLPELGISGAAAAFIFLFYCVFVFIRTREAFGRLLYLIELGLHLFQLPLGNTGSRVRELVQIINFAHVRSLAGDRVHKELVDGAALRDLVGIPVRRLPCQRLVAILASSGCLLMRLLPLVSFQDLLVGRAPLLIGLELVLEHLYLLLAQLLLLACVSAGHIGLDVVQVVDVEHDEDAESEEREAEVLRLLLAGAHPDLGEDGEVLNHADGRNEGRNDLGLLLEAVFDDHDRHEDDGHHDCEDRRSEF
jgi:hypothetical protein